MRSQDLRTLTPVYSLTCLVHVVPGVFWPRQAIPNPSIVREASLHPTPVEPAPPSILFSNSQPPINLRCGMKVGVGVVGACLPLNRTCPAHCNRKVCPTCPKNGILTGGTIMPTSSL